MNPVFKMLHNQNSGKHRRESKHPELLLLPFFYINKEENLIIHFALCHFKLIVTEVKGNLSPISFTTLMLSESEQTDQEGRNYIFKHIVTTE